MCEELFLESDSVAPSHPQINKCDRNNFDTQDLGIVFEKLKGVLEDTLSREWFKEIVNVLPVCYEPAS